MTYFLGPFKKAQPTKNVIKVSVVHRTNFDGATTRTPNMRKVRKAKNPAIQNAIMANVKFFSFDRQLKIFNHP